VTKRKVPRLIFSSSREVNVHVASQRVTLSLPGLCSQAAGRCHVLKMVIVCLRVPVAVWAQHVTFVYPSQECFQLLPDGLIQDCIEKYHIFTGTVVHFLTVFKVPEDPKKTSQSLFSATKRHLR
jgi:hypothetical protein